MELEIKDIMEKILKVPVDENSNRQNIDVWDSFSHLDILVEIEKKYKIEFEPEEMAEINSFQDIIKIVNDKIMWFIIFSIYQTYLN